jgi:autotransporter passenger strand-loop-strand repeat protein
MTDTIIPAGVSSGGFAVSNGDNLYVYGTASLITVSNGGTEYVYLGGSATETTISSGGTENLSGGTDSFTTVSSGGNQNIDSGGSAVDTTIDNGGNQYVYSGGTAISAVAENGGVQAINAGGSANHTTAFNGGDIFVLSGVANSTVISAGGFINVDGGGVASFTTISAAGEADVYSGGETVSTTISNGGNQYVHSGGSAVSTTVLDGGTETVNSSGVASFTAVSSGGYQYVYSAGSAVSTTVFFSGRQNVESGGATSFTTVSSGGAENIFSGSIASYTTVSNGGAFNVGSGGTASFATVSSGGFLNVFSSGTTSFTTVSSGGTEFVYSSGTAVSTTVDSGGFQVLFGSDATGSFTMLSGGTEAVFSGGTATSATVGNGGHETAYNSGTTSFTTVSFGGGEFVEIGGSAVSTTGDAGGYVIVFPGGSQTDTTGPGSIVSTGVVLALSGSAISAYATTDGTSVGYAGTEYVLPDGVTTSTTVYAGGFEFVYSGGTTISTTVSNGGNLYVSSGATASFTTLSSGGNDYVYSSGSTVSSIVDTGGVETVSSGGHAVDAVLSGGYETVSSGGSTTGTVVSSGGFEGVYLGGTASFTTVSSGGFQYVYIGGSAVSTTVDNSGVEHAQGGSTTGTTVENGGEQYVYSGLAVSTTVDAGGEQRVDFGTTSFTTVDAGGHQYVDYGGTTVSTTLSGGVETVSLGGMAVSTTVSNFAVETVSGGGSATYTTVSNGGSVSDYGTVISDTVLSGGTENVLSGGAARETAISSGGIQNVDAYTSVVGTTITDGGVEFVFAAPAQGGVNTGSVISSGGAELLSSGASAVGTVLSDGGYLVVLPGATQTDTVSSGGTVVSTGVVLYQPGSGITDYPGDTGSNLTVSTSSPFTSATEYVLSGGTATSNTVGPNGVQIIYDGGSALDTRMSGNAFRGGTQYVYSGGAATSTFVTAESIEDVYSSGVTSFTTVSGGEELVFAGGKSVDTTVKVNGGGGGSELVEGAFNGGVASNGIAVSTTISSGGHEIASYYGVLSGTVVSSGGYEVISGLGSATSTTLDLGGHIDLAGLHYVAGATSAFLNSATDVLSVTDGSSVYTQQLVGDYEGVFFNTAAGPLTGLDTLVTASETPCYRRGTLILTDRGEVAVEDLRIADRLVTLSGAVRPIRWIGRRSYDGRFAAGNPKILPILFRPHALADGAPRCDLYVSPQHAMFVDGVLIPASALINGISIVQLEAVDEVEYFHFELDTHDVILAQGAPAETFVDDDSRGMFHNAAEYRLLYPDAPRMPARYCAPRVEDGPALEAVRRRLEDRATASAPMSHGALHGYVDDVSPARIAGWARDEASPGEPVRLRILDNDVAVGEVVADRHRPDLARKDIGDGRHGFAFDFPGGLSQMLRHVIRVQRAADGRDLIGSPRVVAASPVTITQQRTPAGGGLLGHLDLVTHDRIVGWAQNEADPSAPVSLQIIDNGVLVTRVLANLARDDLATAEIGTGRHGFDLLIPGGLSPLVRHVIQVRRDSDGAELAKSPAVIEAAGAFDASLERAIANAVAAAASRDDQEHVLSFMLQQADRLVQQRADADARRRERMFRQRLVRRLGPSVPDAPAGPQLRALVIDTGVPMGGHDAGSQAILSHMRALQGLGYAVSFVAADQMAVRGAALAALRATRVEWCGAPFYASAEDVMRRQSGCFDLVYLHRAPIATRYLGLARRYLPKARILYSVADLHHVRLERQAAVEGRPELLAASRRQWLEECMAAWSADAVLTHSVDETAILRQAVPEANVYRVPWSVPERDAPVPFAARHGIAFIGGYGHTPNVDAARWLVEDVMPLVWRDAPQIECLLVGSDMPESMRDLERQGVVLLGAVADLGSVFDRVRLTVAPLRYGAGVKGKVLDSLASGVPCVMSPVAAEGLALPPGLSALVGADAGAIADLIRWLYSDADAHRAAASAGRSLIREQHGEAAVVAALRAAAEGLGAPPKAGGAIAAVG